MVVRCKALGNFIAASLIAFLANPVQAADECGCSAALDVNLMYVFSSTFGAAGTSTSLTDYCEKQSSTSGTASSAGGTVGYAGFQLGFNSANARSSSSLSALCDKSYASASNDERLSVLRRSVNPVLAESFSACIKACANTDFGFEVKKTDLSMTVNVFQKRDGATIRAFTVIVDDTDPSSDEAESIKCILEAGGSVYVPRYLGNTETDISQRDEITLDRDKSALISCTREQHEYVGDGVNNGLFFFPGYTLVLGVGERQISPYVPVRGSQPISSAEFKMILQELEKVEKGFKNIDDALAKTDESVGFLSRKVGLQ